MIPLLIILFAQIHTPFERLTIEDGLSQNMVNDIILDKRGFLWFATKDGLNRFDGYSFKVYRNLPGDSNTLSSNYVTGLWEDPKGMMWIVTNGGGLNRFDPIAESFSRIEPSGDTSPRLDIDVLSHITGKDSTIWMLSRAEGLIEYRPYSKRFIKVSDRFHGMDMTNVISFTVSSLGNIWTASAEEVNYLDMTNETLLRYSLIGREQQPTNLYLLNDSVALAPTRTGINRIERRNGSLVIKSTPITGRSFGYSSKMMQIPGSDDVWLTTLDGFYRFDPHGEILTNIFSIDTRPTTGLLVDRSGIVWIGTAGWGVIKYNPSLQHFKTGVGNLLGAVYPTLLKAIRGRDIVDLTERGTEFHSIIQTSDGDLWMVNPGFKLFRYNLASGRLTEYLAGRNLRPHGVNRRFNLIAEDSKGTIWLASAGGVYRLMEREDELDYHPIYEGARTDTEYLNPTGSPDITAMYFDAQDRLWLGTPDRGIALYDPLQKTVHWIKYGENNQNTISSNRILCIVPDPNPAASYLWVGTEGGGLNRLSMDDFTSRRFYMTDGLPNMVVYSILPDDAGHLWMSTNYGLSRFKPSTMTFRNFTMSDGIHSNEFNRNEFLKLSDGTMYFGGIDGFTWFHPNEILVNVNVPIVRITNFLVHNRPVDNKKWEMLRREDGTPLELEFKQNMFTIEFAALEFTASDRNRYKYMMEGFDQDWIESGYNRSATYTNLSPGTYTFRVLASNNDRLWNEVSLQVPITIHPPFWMTWWFRTWMVLVVIGMVMYAYRRRVRTIESEKTRLEEISHQLIEREEEERQRIAREMHDSLGQELLVMKQWVGKWSKTQVKGQNHSHYVELSDQISRILKSVRGITHNLRPPELDRIGVTETVRFMLEESGKASGISIDLDFDDIDALLSFDHPIHILRIFQEMLSNAIRHGHASHIQVSMKRLNDTVVIRFKDDGIGFDRHQPDKPVGLGLSGISERVRFLHGSIKVHTEPGQGVEFIINLPIQTAI